MAIMKILLLGAVISGLCGIGGFALKEGAETVIDFSDDWHWGRGGCRGGSSYYGEDNDNFSHCHEKSENNGEYEYCPYHDEYFSEDEWEDHSEDCPMYE
jgi:hypothetical protein